MQPLTIECYVKPKGAVKSTPSGQIRFCVNPEDHLRLEETVEQLQDQNRLETMIPVETSSLELGLPPDIDALEDCKLRVYLHKQDRRGHFHLVARRKSDGSLVYTNASMIDYVAS